MTETTITEALAELKTLGKRMSQKKDFVCANLARASVMTDALAKDGGSEKRVAEEVQSYADLVARHESIRVLIQQANHRNTLEIGGWTRTVAAWLTWRKECAPRLKDLYSSMNIMLRDARPKIEGKVSAGVTMTLITHFSEDDLRGRLEKLESVLGALDGRLSLFNATCKIDVP